MSLCNSKVKVAEMARLVLKMWQTTFSAFMEHDLDLLAEVLADEKKLNDFEKTLTAALVEEGRSAPLKEERGEALRYVDIVADLEIIGDYCKDILERIEIKIQERLLFSDDAVKEYAELYRKTEEALKEVTDALEKSDPRLVREVIKGGQHIDSLVDEYRQRHNQRLLDGVCSPLACNMFLNMLDFTAAVYYHAKKIARTLLKLK